MANLLHCIRSVCATARNVNALLARQGIRAKGVGDDLQASGAALSCVLNGPIGATCTLPKGGSVPTMAEALARLSASSITSIAVESATSTAAQTEWVLSAAPAGVAYLQVEYCGARLHNPTDYTLSGAAVAFAYPLDEGRQLVARRYVI